MGERTVGPAVLPLPDTIPFCQLARPVSGWRDGQRASIVYTNA